MPPKKIQLLLGAIFCGLPLLDLAIHGQDRLFRYFAADTFYYMTVAANFDRAHFFTFDQVTPTNGFHPFWQVVLCGLYQIARLFADPRRAMLWLTWALSFGLTSAGLLIIARPVVKQWRQLGFLVLLLPLGVCLVPGIAYQPRYASFWNQINGMESGLLLLGFAGLFCLLIRADPLARGRWILAGLLIAWMALARMDAVFAGPAFLSCALIDIWARPGGRAGVRLTKAIGACAIAAAPVVAYMLYSNHAAGFYMPVSGLLKTSFPHIRPGNFAHTASLLSPKADSGFAQHFAFRYALLITPLAIAAAWLVSHAMAILRRGRDAWTPWNRALLFSCLFVFALHAYNWLFVDVMSQGHWYYPASMLAASIVAGDWIARREALQRHFATGDRARNAALLCAAASLAYFFLFFFPQRPLHARIGAIWAETPYTRHDEMLAATFNDRAAFGDRFGAAPPELVELDDGIAAYALGVPTMAVTMLNADTPAVVEVLQGGNILDIAWRRGYRRLVSTYELRAPLLFDNPTTETLTAHIRAADPKLYGPFNYGLEYISPSRAYFVIRFEPAK